VCYSAKPCMGPKCSDPWFCQPSRINLVSRCRLRRTFQTFVDEPTASLPSGCQSRVSPRAIAWSRSQRSRCTPFFSFQLLCARTSLECMCNSEIVAKRSTLFSLAHKTHSHTKLTRTESHSKSVVSSLARAISTAPTRTLRT
jgi:hypothetical protein